MSGTLFLLGTGPGDPELLTLKAARLLAGARVVACFAKRGHAGRAYETALPHLHPQAETLHFRFPMTIERDPNHPEYRAAMEACYDEAADALAARLHERDAVLLCEGDPLFYGSAMYVLDRLRGRFPVESVPGITGMGGCWNAALLPIAHGDDALLVLPGTLPGAALRERLEGAEAAVIMKAGRHLPAIRAALAETGLLERAVYVEQGTTPQQRVLPMRDAPAEGPYFSLVLVPGRCGAR